MAESDLLSYPVFDTCYMNRPIMLRHDDAETVADQIVDVLGASREHHASRR